MTERQGIEIDYCPSCRGVWLDRGELDKLIAESGSDSQSNYQTGDRPQFKEQRSSHSDDRSYKDDRYKYDKKHKKESFLGNLFDF